MTQTAGSTPQVFSSYEECRRNLERLAQSLADAPGDRNEATTRLQIIDRLLFDCLAWSRDDATLEESQDGEYTDYTLASTRPLLIVEAKKESDYFELPAGTTRSIIAIRSLMRDYPSLKAALTQLSNYCQHRGVPFGAISNGHQIIAMVAARNDSVPPLHGKALVFPSFQYMLDNFLELWQCLSKPAIEKKLIHTTLIGHTTQAPPSKLSSTFSIYPGVKNRNTVQADLQIVTELVVEDIAQTRELEEQFLLECYSKSGALSQTSLLSKNILESRYAALFDTESGGPTPIPAVTKKGDPENLLAEGASRRPILLLGDIGVGKTIFLRHLSKVAAKNAFKNSIDIYIDLGTKATLTQEIDAFVLNQLSEQLRRNSNIDIDERNFVRGVYHGELQRFRKGIYGDLMLKSPETFKEKELEFLEGKLQDKVEHLKSCLAHISKGHEKQIVIFIDNADQRSDSIQQKSFLIAQELAAEWPCIVFVSLRPETYFRSKRIGTIGAYHAKAFTIAPPRIDDVIKRRLSFSRRIANGDIRVRALGDTEIELTRLRDLLTVFLFSIEANASLLECIDSISSGNIRIALDLVRGFFGSGHVDTGKILENFDNWEKYTIPLHEFLRATLYGDAIHYSPEQSPIVNIFDVSSEDRREHFLLPLIVEFLIKGSLDKKKSGFVETEKIYDVLQSHGFVPDQIDAALIRARESKLVQSSAGVLSDAPAEALRALRVTSLGIYHTRKLSELFAYYDAMVIDTPIFDEGVRGEIKDEQGIKGRLDRAEKFAVYLGAQWGDLSGAKDIFDWPERQKAVVIDIENIRRRLGLR